MTTSEVKEFVLAMPEDERIELARLIIASVVDEPDGETLVADGIRRLEDMASGRTIGLDEAAFRAAI